MAKRRRRRPPVIDPTANVIALSQAASKRTDDLAAASEALERERIRRVEDLSYLRAEHNRQIMDIHARHDEQLHDMEMRAINGLGQRTMALEKSSYESSGKGQGISATWAAVIGAAGLAGTLIMIGLFVFGGRGNTASTTPQQPTYAPAAPGTLVPSQPAQPTAR